MKSLYILKIGGSVATHKNQPGVSVRTKLIEKVAISIKEAMKNGNFNLILIHGAGAAGHQLAHQYDLRRGTKKNKTKRYGALLSRIANQKLDSALAEIFVSAGLQVAPIHTASVIIQDNKKIVHCDMKIIHEALKQNYIPLFYGEMIFDKTLGMSICSGDTIAPYLSKELKARKIFFASDIDGIFTKDPHLFNDAELIREIKVKEIKKQAKLSRSHNIDTTDGLLGKIKNVENMWNKNLDSIELFNGLNPKNYQKVLSGKKFNHTSIKK